MEHPMCKECIALPVCGVKYGQPACVKVHGLTMSYGKTIVNSEAAVAQNSTSNNSQMDAIALFKRVLVVWNNDDPDFNDNNLDEDIVEWLKIAQRHH